MRIVNQTLNLLKVSKHPNKTWIGKIDQGFVFLGYHHTRAGLSPAKDTLKRFRQRLTQLYEQGASEARVGAYRKRWASWVCAGLPGKLVLIDHKMISRLASHKFGIA